jgi:uncharacterized protein YndB with AHSA1/START domain
MEINQNAPLVDRKSILVHAPRTQVWQLLSQIEAWPSWYPAVSKAELEGPLASATVFRWTSGGMAIVSTLRLVEEQRRLGWTGSALGTSSEHIWRLEDAADGTLVSTEESMSGWLIYPVKLITPRFLTEALESWLVALKQAAEKQVMQADAVAAGAS